MIKVSLYADDTTVFVQDLDSVTHLLTLLQNVSGLEINRTECGSAGGSTKLIGLSAFAGHEIQLKLLVFSFLMMKTNPTERIKLRRENPELRKRPSIAGKEEI